MDSNLVATAISVTGVTITVAGAAFTAWRSGKDRQDREADRTVAKATAEKLREEKRQITEQTTGMVLTQVREELERTKNELDRAYKDAQELRDLLREKNDQIDTQDRIIRRLTRRAETLEEWIEANKLRFLELGIDGLPEDLFGDRKQ